MHTPNPTCDEKIMAAKLKGNNIQKLIIKFKWKVNVYLFVKCSFNLKQNTFFRLGIWIMTPSWCLDISNLHEYEHMKTIWRKFAGVLPKKFPTRFDLYVNMYEFILQNGDFQIFAYVMIMAHVCGNGCWLSVSFQCEWMVELHIYFHAYLKISTF